MLIRAMAMMLTVLVMATLAPAQGGGEGVVFRPTLPVGREMIYEVAQSIAIEQEREGAEKVADDFVHVARLRLVVTGEKPEGARTMSAKIADLVIVGGTGGQRARFTGGDQAGSLKLPALEGEMAGDEGLDALGKALMDAGITFEVSAAGEVSNLSGLESGVEALGSQKTFVLGAGETAVPDARILGPFVPGNFQEVLTRILQVDGAGDAARKAGEAWTTTRSVPLPPVGAMQITNDWTLGSVEGDAATITGAMKLSVERAEGATAETPTAAIDNAQGTTTIVWDTAKGSLRQRDTQQSIVSTWTLGELSVKQTQTFSMVIRTPAAP